MRRDRDTAPVNTTITMSDEQEHKDDVKPKLTVQVQFQSQGTGNILALLWSHLTSGTVCTVKVKSTTQFKKIFEAAEVRLHSGEKECEF